MVFSWSNDSGCQQNSSSPTTWNSNPVSPGEDIHPGVLNYLREAIEDLYQFYKNKNSASPSKPSWSNDETPQKELNFDVRAANINELKHAINKVRTNINVCECNGPNCWNQETCPSWHALGCGWHCRENSNRWYGNPGLYTWTCVSNTDSGTDPKRVGVNDTIDGAQCEELRAAIDLINNASTWGTKNTSGNHLTFLS